MARDTNGDGEVPCDKCGARFDPRGIGAHEAACDGDGGKSQDGDGEMPGRAWWRDHADTLAAIGGVKSQDDVPIETTLGRAWAKRSDMDAREAYRRVFGSCPVEGCENGRNGFDARTCKAHEGEYPDGRDGESGESDQLTVEIDGKEVTGDRATIRALLNE